MEILILLFVIIIVLCIAILIISLRNRPDFSPFLERYENLSGKLDAFTYHNDESLDDISKDMSDLTKINYDQMLKINETLNTNAERQSEKITSSIQKMEEETKNSLIEIRKDMNNLIEQNHTQMSEINKTLREDADKQTEKVNTSILAMQESNEKRLEEMRRTVDEKLSETLNERLGASFKTVSDQLTNVYKSLGEMKELSSGVTDNVKSLNKVLTNVKARGTWAEVQLANILDEIIPHMYDTNVKTNPNYNGQVEFAVRVPVESDDGSENIIYLPVDSKFPMEDYLRLQDAAENGDYIEMEKARNALEARVKDEGRLVGKYISPPFTTPFAILYLATEGLYAEIASSKNGLMESLQSQGIMVTGPSTITALLNSFAVGFRTVAINKKANEVWKVLGAAKTQYEKFGGELAIAKKKIEDAGRALDNADKRNSIIQKKLREVETLEIAKARNVLQLDSEDEEGGDYHKESV